MEVRQNPRRLQLPEPNRVGPAANWSGSGDAGSGGNPAPSEQVTLLTTKAALPTERNLTAVAIGGVAFAAVYVLLAGELAAHSSYDTWGALIVGTVLAVITLPLLHGQAAREQDPTLFWLLVLALIAKLSAGGVRLWSEYAFYGGPKDAALYNNWGMTLYPMFRAFHFGALPTRPFAATGFVELLTGAVYTIIGPTEAGGYVFFAWLSFLGLFLTYRAYVIAVPQGKSRHYFWLLFFLPTLLYWPAAIGKDAWMSLTIGITAYGAARALSGNTWRGLVIAAAGLWLGALVRPQISGMLAVALACAFLIKPIRRDLKALAPVAKLVTLVAVIALSAVLVVKTQSYLKTSFVGATGTKALQNLADITAQEGASEYTPPLATNPKNIPKAIVTVLYRPFPFEAHNKQELLAALECMVLLGLTIWRWRWVVAAFRSVRRQPYVVFAIVYVAEFIFAFSALANFGLLARERAQMLPLFLVLLTIPPRPSPAEDRETGVEEVTHAGRARA